jgi:hypothetical protein
MEKMLLVYMGYCITPLIDGLINFMSGYDEKPTEPTEDVKVEDSLQDFYLRSILSLAIFIVINGFFTISIIVDNIKQHAAARDRNANTRVKAKAEREAPDATWDPPVRPMTLD